MYYLYIKTHNETGLKYLGKTQQDPQKYKGSGKRWKSHIKKHGYNVNTEIIGIFQTNEALKEVGQKYSIEWNIVESKEWANLKEECGDGGPSPFNLELNRINAKKANEASVKAQLLNPRPGIWKGLKRGPRSIESIEKQRISITGKKKGTYENYNYEAVKAQPVIFRGKQYPSVSSAAKDNKASRITVQKYAMQLQPSQVQEP